MMAHDAVMKEHQGQKKIEDRISKEFWWPGFGADVRRYCKSCDVCQRKLLKEKLKKCC